MGCVNSKQQSERKKAFENNSPDKAISEPSLNKKVKIGIIFYSTYGHCHKLAEKIAEGAKSVGADVEIRRVAETLPDEVVEKMGGVEARKAWMSLPVATPEDLTRYDAIAIGGPTRFGLPSAQLKTFFDSLGGLWMKDALVGKHATVFGCSSSQHGGNEMNLIMTMIPLFHLGYAVVGLPYSFKGQSETKEIVGGSPYGMTTVSLNNQKDPKAIELEGAHFQGKHLVEVMTKKPV